MSPPSIQVNSIGELRKVEKEAVSRLNEAPRLAQLFIIDPVGALATVGVVLSREAVAEWSKLIGSPLPTMPPQARDLAAKSTAQEEFKVRIHGILPPGPGASPTEATPR